MKKRFLTLLLSATMLFSVAGFSACTNGELEAKIAELEAQIATQQTQILEQQAQIAELEQENEELQASIIEQQEQIETLEQEINSSKLKKIIWKEYDVHSWYTKVEITVFFPREVLKGDDFTIKVTTKNVSNLDIEYNSGTCCSNRGVGIDHIESQSSKAELFFYHSLHNADVVKTVIKAGESINYEEIISTTYADNGVYDLYFANGEAYINAIEII